MENEPLLRVSAECFGRACGWVRPEACEVSWVLVLSSRNLRKQQQRHPKGVSGNSDGPPVWVKFITTQKKNHKMYQKTNCL